MSHHNRRRKRKPDHIRHRGLEVTRIEAFSDAVFAFGVTLLIVSLEVPHNFSELVENLLFFIPFGFCFFIVYAIWYQQNLFFRRYGLHDRTIVALNGILLFVVLMYMFPLKFIFGAMFSHEKFHFDSAGQFSTLFCLYAGGFACFYLLFALMHLHAYRERDTIALTDMEAFRTQTKVYNFLTVAVVSVIAVCIAAMGDNGARFAGCSYSLLWPASALLNKRRDAAFKAKFGPDANALAEVEPIGEHVPVSEN